MSHDDTFDEEAGYFDATALRNLSEPAFAALGNGAVAYVKAVVVDEQPAFAVHGADGRPLAVVAERDLAFAVILQNDLEPLSVH